MTDAERDNQRISDGLLGKDMEVYYKHGASMYPEFKAPRGCTYLPLALTQAAAYQELISLSAKASLASGQCARFAAELIDTRDYYLDRSRGKSMFTDSEELRVLYGRAAAAMYRVIAEAINSQRKHAGEHSAAQQRMRDMEREYYASLPPVPDNERYSGMGKEAFEKQAAWMKEELGGEA